MSKKSKTIIGIGIFAIILLFAVLFVVKNENNAEKPVVRRYENIIKSGRLRVVTDGSSLGFNGKEISGFNYEIAKIFADTLGVELEITVMNDLDSCILGIKENKFDILAECLPTTSKLKKNIKFSIPIYTSKQVLVQLKNGNKNVQPNNLRFLASDSICIPLHSPQSLRLENLSNEIAQPIKIVEMKGKTTDDLVKMVSEGKIKYTLCNELLSRKLKKTYPNIDIETPVGFTQPLAWGVNLKSQQLYKELNDFLSDFLVSTDYWDIYRKYF